MVCSGLEVLTDPTISSILAFPNSCDYYFWAKIMGAFWIILTLTMFFREKEIMVKPDIISCLGVASIATTFVNTIGTFLNIMPLDVFIKFTIVMVIFIGLWMFKD